MAEGLMDFSDVISKGTLRDETFRCLLLVCATSSCKEGEAREKNWSGKWQEISLSPGIHVESPRQSSHIK